MKYIFAVHFGTLSSSALIRDDQLHDGSWCDHHDLTLQKGCGSGLRSHGSGYEPQEKKPFSDFQEKKRIGIQPTKKKIVEETQST